jgi:phospholipase/lecithinase/hemolysin
MHTNLKPFKQQFTAIYTQPSNFLNGTAPPNVQSWVNQCDVQGNNCNEQQSPDSYLWYDELHPSEQTDRIVAREFAKVVNGESAFAEYVSVK